MQKLLRPEKYECKVRKLLRPEKYTRTFPDATTSVRYGSCCVRKSQCDNNSRCACVCIRASGRDCALGKRCAERSSVKD
eukprot:361797-Chlamydomonas_euryale.AAC.2